MRKLLKPYYKSNDKPLPKILNDKITLLRPIFNGLKKQKKDILRFG